MMGFDSPNDPEPLGYIGGRPVHAPTALAILHALMLVVCVLLKVSGAGDVVNNLIFRTSDVFHDGHVWQILTYPFAHGAADAWQIVWLGLELAMLATFGREIEKMLGRKFFLGLYLALILVVPLVIGLYAALRGQPQVYVKESSALHSCVFLAFALIYPRVTFSFFFVPIEARWAAAVWFGAVSLYGLANGQTTFLLAVWSSAILTWAALRLNGVGEGWALMDALRRRAETRAAARRAAATPAARPVKTRPASFRSIESSDSRSAGADSREDVLDSVDPLLDKIARSGLASLTQTERAQLEKARHALLRRGERK